MKETTIAEIIRNKPGGTNLYSPIFGECTFSFVQDGTNSIFVINSNKNHVPFNSKGLYYDGGECLLFPSRLMRDWGKFAWKKGDVLVSNDGKREVLFKTWVNDSYTKFVGLHCLINNDNEEVEYDNGTTVFNTNDFKGIEEEDVAQTYINTIEERLGGKLNRETLEIEKSQPELKDGDIVFMKGIKDGYFANCIFILRSEYKDGDERAFYYAFYNADDKFTIAEYGNTRVHYSLRPATDSEKQQLFEALAKKNKCWDAEKKQIVDLKPKIELKPFDKVLSRRCSEDYWVLNFYSHKSHKTDYHICIDGSSNLYCIPYNEETAHLLGTTDDWEGGEV